MKNLILVFFFFIALSTNVRGQFVPVTGQTPPGIDWQQIETDYVTVIFPKGLARQATRIANMVEYLRIHNQKSIGEKWEKISIILKNEGVISNGFVTPIPYHSEFFAAAPPVSFAGPTNWLDELTIHEYRHVMQFNNTQHGITKFGKKLFGANVWAGLFGTALPDWFFEGDAVVQETALTHSGRGRNPNFLTSLRIIADLEKPFSYEKIRNHSYKDYIPSHYPLGYAMTLYARKKFGNDIWKNVVEDAVRYRGLFFPFSQGLKKRTGLSTPQLYKAVLKDLKPVKVARKAGFYQPQIIAQGEKNNPTQYRYPKFGEDGTIYFTKKSANERMGIYRLTEDNREEKLLTMGVSMDALFDVKGNTIVWDEISYHPRWNDISYSDIYRYDTGTKSIKRLTKKQRLFSPSLSPDATKIVAVQIDKMMRNNLVILSPSGNGKLTLIPNPENYLPSFPIWLDKDNIAAVIQRNQQQAIAKIDIHTGKYEPLMDFTAHSIAGLSTDGGRIYFTASFHDKMDIYAIDIRSREVIKMTDAKYGAETSSVSPDGSTLLFTDRQFNQSVLKKISTTSGQTVTGSIPEPYETANPANTIAQMEGGTIVDKDFSKKLAVTAYNPGRHLLKFHSITPYPATGGMGLYIQSSNIMSTMGWDIFPAYNFYDKYFSLKTELVYMAHLPVLKIGATSHTDRNFYTLGKTQIDTLGWKEADLSASVGIPLHTVKRNFDHRFEIEAGYQFVNRFFNTAYPQFESGFSTGSLTLTLSDKQLKAYRNINSRWGQTLFLSYKRVLNESGFDQFYASETIFLPGLMKTHNLSLRGIFQSENIENNYQFENLWRNDVYYLSKLYDKVFDFRAKYSFPVLYPDLAVGPVLFFKRLRSNLVYNYDKLIYNDRFKTKEESFHSIGIELITDISLFRTGDYFDLPIGIGIDYVMAGDNSLNYWNYRLVLDF